MKKQALLKLCASVLLALLIGCGGGEAPVEQPVETAAAPGANELTVLLPADGAVPGWVSDGEPRFFTADNLWEFINGAADGYLMYGFEEVVTADFSQESSGQAAVIDIYQMMDPTHAFGIYCQERNPDYEFLEIGSEGYLGGTSLNFWKGPYYVKLTVFEESEEIQGELKKLAEHVAGKIGHPAGEPPQVAAFPTENQKPRSIQFLPRDVLGQSYLSNAFEAQYQVGEQEYKIVAITASDAAAATEGYTKYKEFLARSNPEMVALEGVGDEGLIGEDSFYGKVLAVRAGNRILVILGAPSVDDGKTVLAGMLDRM
jgi:hypothetical protein